jgi:hypothetical protein
MCVAAITYQKQQSLLQALRPGPSYTEMHRFAECSEWHHQCFATYFKPEERETRDMAQVCVVMNREEEEAKPICCLFVFPLLAYTISLHYHYLGRIIPLSTLASTRRIASFMHQVVRVLARTRLCKLRVRGLAPRSIQG